MKTNIKNKTCEVSDTKTSPPQPTITLSQGVQRRRLGLKDACYYGFIALALLCAILILTAQLTRYVRQCEKKAEEGLQMVSSLPTDSPSSSLDVTTESYLFRKKQSADHIDLDESKGLSEETVQFLVQSNPFNLSIKETARQWWTAKVPSLKRRVKRFACWHSCFGQFRKKAFRSLYGSATLFPSSPTPPKASVAAEHVEQKRAATETATSGPVEKGSENNELGEGEEKGTSEARDTTSKLNASTDFFKLKTKVVEEKLDEANADTTSPVNILPITDSATDSPASKENTRKTDNENRANTKPKTKEKPSGKKNPKTASATVDEESESAEEGDNTEEDAEESESPEGADDDGETSGSNESVEDKGDGIDKKDLEDEEN